VLLVEQLHLVRDRVRVRVRVGVGVGVGVRVRARVEQLHRLEVEAVVVEDDEELRVEVVLG
jgi:hypothetical protein